jgi:DNA-binding PadR family transcriptional regulator
MGLGAGDGEFAWQLRTLGDRPKGILDAELLADAGAEPGSEQGVTAERVEVVVDTDPLQAEQLAEEGTQLCFMGVARPSAAHGGHVLRPPSFAGVGVSGHPHMITVLGDHIPPDIRSAVQGGLHGWHRLQRFQAAMPFPSLHSAAEHLGIHQNTLVTQFQRLEKDIGGQLFHRTVFGRPQQPTERGRALLHALEQDEIKTLMTQSIQPDWTTARPEPEVVKQAAANASQRRNPGPPKPYNTIAVDRIRITRPVRIALQALLDSVGEDIYGLKLRRRTRLDYGSIYPLLARLTKAGWLTARWEDETSWRARNPPGQKHRPRRRYYRLTPEGQRAALHELKPDDPAAPSGETHRRKRRKRKTGETDPTQDR